MTEGQNTEAKPKGRKRAERGYGWVPVTSGGVLAAVLIALLVPSGIGAAGAMTAPSAAIRTQPTEAPPTPGTGAPTPGAGDPSTPPDRGSDQPVASPKGDTVYLIQDGDTLTSISAKLGMSVDSIAAYNAVRDVNVIDAGAVLRVPFIYVPPTTTGQ